MGIFATLRANVSWHSRNARTYANAYGFILVQCISISRGMDLFDHGYARFEKQRSSLKLTYLGPAFHQHSAKLTIVWSFDSLILLHQREGEEREIRKFEEAMRPFSNNNTERPSEMLECIWENEAVVANHNFVTKWMPYNRFWSLPQICCLFFSTTRYLSPLIDDYN